VTHLFVGTIPAFARRKRMLRGSLIEVAGPSFEPGASRFLARHFTTVHGIKVNGNGGAEKTRRTYKW
jgi:hypothetical protein